VHVDAGWIGKRLTTLGDHAGARIAFVTRYGEAVIPTGDTVLQENDLVHVLYRVDQRETVETIMGRPPEVH